MFRRSCHLRLFSSLARLFFPHNLPSSRLYSFCFHFDPTANPFVLSEGDNTQISLISVTRSPTLVVAFGHLGFRIERTRVIWFRTTSLPLSSLTSSGSAQAPLPLSLPTPIRSERRFLAGVTCGCGLPTRLPPWEISPP